MVPCSTRTMYGTVRPSSVVVVGTSAGGLSASYGRKTPGAARYWYSYVGAVVHFASFGGLLPPEALSQIQGCTCAPASTGPPEGWLVIVRWAVCPPAPAATTSFGPLRR